MDFALFQEGVDQIVQGGIADTVGFHLLGEPLLYPRIFEAIGYAHRRGLRTELNTNGALLTEEWVRSLAEAGLNLLAISLQMLDEQAHECRESRLPFRAYYAGVLQAVRQMKALGGRTEVTLVVMNTATKRFFDVDQTMRIDGDGHSFKEKLVPLLVDTCTAVGRNIRPEEAQATLKRLNLLKPRVIRLDAQVTVSILPFADWGNAFTSRKVYPARIGYCDYALTNVGVLSNGEVTICCADYDGRTSLGNLYHEPLATMLASEQARAIRQGFDRMRVAHPYCQRCIGGTSRMKAAFKGLASIGFFKLIGFRPAGKLEEVSLRPQGRRSPGRPESPVEPQVLRRGQAPIVASTSH